MDEIIVYSKLSDEELIDVFKLEPHISICQELCCRRNENNKKYSGFSEQFLYLLDRLELIEKIARKFKEIEALGIEPVVLHKSIIDSCYSSLRALFLESSGREKNYTLQNCILELGYNYYAKMINDILESELIFAGMSFKNLIKRVTDKTIAHLDYINDENDFVNYKYDIFLNVECNYKIHNVLTKCIKIYNDFLRDDTIKYYPELESYIRNLKTDIDDYLEEQSSHEY